MLRTPTPGRRRVLNCNKKRLLCDAVARGATMTEAAVTVGVSLRTVQREARLDPAFDGELRTAHAAKPDPLAIMQSAARTHWRAAAWLLERTNPEDYGRRPALSCSPFQFEEALRVVVDAALRLTPPENRSQVYACLTETSETAFKAVFPTCGPGSRRLVERLPDTPLADEQRMRRLTEPQFQRVIFQDEMGCITEPSLHEQPPHETPDRAAIPNETPGPRPGPDELAEPVDHSPEPPAASATLLNPDPNRIPPTPTPDFRLPWHYNLRAALTNPVLSLLSPKTDHATKPNPRDTTPNHPPLTATR